MRFHLLACGAVLAFVWDAACAQHQATQAAPQGTGSTASTSSGFYEEFKRRAPGTVEALRRQARRVYRDLFETLQVNLEESDRLVDSLTEEEVLRSTWSMDDGIDRAPQPEDFARADAIRADIKTMLGPERFAELVAYRDTRGVRYRLLRLDERLYSVGRSMSHEQKEQLVRIMVAGNDEVGAALLNSPGTTLEGAQQQVAQLDKHDLQLQKRFGSVLTLEQLEIAKLYFADRAQQRKEALESYRQQIAAGDSSPAFGLPAEAL